MMIQVSNPRCFDSPASPDVRPPRRAACERPRRGDRVPRRQQAGFTLVEMTVVFLVIVVLTVLAVPRVQALIIEGSTPSVAQEMQRAVNRIRSARAGAGVTPYATVSLAEMGAVLRNSNYTVTPAAPEAATAIRHPLGSGQGAAALTVATGSLVAAGDSFVVTYAEVDRAGCAPLMATLSGSAEVVSITPNGGNAIVVKANGGTFNGGLAQSTCADRNTLAFTFR
jgi:Tfp pilus assembly protein FimT